MGSVEGLSGNYYARLLKSSLPIVVVGKDADDLASWTEEAGGRARGREKTMRIRNLLAAGFLAVVAAGLTACGDSSPPPRPPTIQSAAQHSGCTGLNSYYRGELFTIESAHCSTNCTPGEIAVFPAGQPA
jgi:hypothetical protein